MPVPLNAFTEVIRCWFTKRLGYLVDDSVPVRFHEGRIPSDIDMICIHPVRKKIKVKFLGNKVCLNSRLLVESKGWFDIDPGYAMDSLLCDSRMLRGIGGNTIPKRCTKKEDGFTFSILKEEVFKKGREFFGTENFDRIIIIPHLKDKHKSKKLITRKEIIEYYRRKGVIIIEMKDILIDLFEYLKEKDAKDNLRKNFVLEFLHLIEVYRNSINKISDAILNSRLAQRRDK